MKAPSQGTSSSGSLAETTNHISTNRRNNRLTVRYHRDESDDSSENEERISHVEDHRIIHTKLTQFQLVYRINGQKLWFDEKDCKGCIDLINSYCRKKNIEISTIRPTLCGAIPSREPNTAIWKSIDDILKMVKTYGEKSDMQKEIFRKLENKDAIYLLQVGSHCVVITRNENLHYR